MPCRTIFFLLTLTLLAPGCATKQARPNENAMNGASEILVHQIEYSSKGLPLFSKPLSERPSKNGESFTLVQVTNGQATKSYDIVVISPETDFIRPLEVIYEWTGKGFVEGAKVTGHAVNGLSGQSGEYTLALVLAPMAVGTAGGFVIGVADGMWKTAEEVGRLILGKDELVVAFTTYEYDDHARLKSTHLYKLEDPQHEVARTEYSYQDDALEPLKATIHSFPDGAVRVVE